MWEIGEVRQMNWMAAGGLASAAFAVFFVLWIARIAVYREQNENDGQAEFSVLRYEPMLRLATGEDLDFLAAQPGYRPEIGARLRRAHRRILRMYLRELARDFHRIHRDAREMIASGSAEHAPLVGALMRQQIAFWRGMALVEARLSFRLLGRVNPRAVLDVVEAMRIEVARASAVA